MSSQTGVEPRIEAVAIAMHLTPGKLNAVRAFNPGVKHLGLPASSACRGRVRKVLAGDASRLLRRQASKAQETLPS